MTREADLEVQQPPDLDALRLYAERTAGSLLLLSLECAGVRDETMAAPLRQALTQVEAIVRAPARDAAPAPAADVSDATSCRAAAPSVGAPSAAVPSAAAPSAALAPPGAPQRSEVSPGQPPSDGAGFQRTWETGAVVRAA